MLRTRSPFRSFALASLVWVIAACSTFAPPTNVHVLRVPEGERAVLEEGEGLKLSRWEIALTREGLKRGYFVVKSDLEWRELWPNVDSDKVPLLPFDIDFGREMLLVSSPGNPDAVGSQFKNVIVADRAVHVYVTETELGVDCPPNPDAAAKNYDLVRVPRVDDKEVTFHVEPELGDACGKAPTGHIVCKLDASVAGARAQPVPAPGAKLSVDPATKVACVVSGLESSRPVFDLTWVWDSIPLGSVAKIEVAKGSRSITFVPEVIGTYRLGLEISDDLARKGTVTADVEVAAPPAPLAFQLVWTHLDANDDPSTFPRIDLHALGVTVEPPAPGKTVPRAPKVAWGAVKDCAMAATNATPVAAANPSWCTTKNAGSTLLMTLDPAVSKDYALAVHYADERVPGQPVLCLRAYRDGKMQAERCDSDSRNAETWWDVGVIDSRSGKTMEMAAQELAAAQAKANPPKPDGGVTSTPAADAAAPSPPKPK